MALSKKAMADDLARETPPEAAAAEDDLSRFDVHPEDLPRRTRRSTINAAGLDTDLPAGLLPPGWVAAWFPFTVYNEPVETWQTTAIADGGWEVVPARLILDRQRRSDHRILPDDWAGRAVERGGQRLYMRPEYLDQESRREDIERARRQSRGRLDSARIDDPRAPHIYNQRSRDHVFVEPGVARTIDALAAESEMTRESRRQARANTMQREAAHPSGDPITTSADDINAAERADIAERYRRPDGRVRLE